jgi:hypothetical protein
MTTHETAEPAGEAAATTAVEELRALGLLVLDRLDPLVARLTAGDHHGADGDLPCTSCPFCAAVAGLRGEHADTAAAVARHAVGLIAALRAALAQAGPPAPTGGAAPATERVVQRIPVERVPPTGGTPSC